MQSAINLQEKFGLFSEQWKPKVIAEMNDYQFKLVKLKGDFVWHRRMRIRTKRSSSSKASCGSIFAMWRGDDWAGRDVRRAEGRGA